MDIIFANKQFYKIETDEVTSLNLPLNIIKALRRKLVILRSAPDEQTLRNWKSLHYEKLKGDRKDQKSIRLNDQWRIVFTLNNDTNPPSITIIDIEDYH